MTKDEIQARIGENAEIRAYHEPKPVAFIVAAWVNQRRIPALVTIYDKRFKKLIHMYA